MTLKIMIRPVESKDIPQILDLYSFYILNSSCTFEEEVPSLESFTERVNRILQTYPFLVYVNENDQVLGYAYASEFRKRVAYRFTTEVSFLNKTQVIDPHPINPCTFCITLGECLCG